MDLGSVISLALFSFGLMVIIAGLASLLIRGIVIVLAGARAKAIGLRMEMSPPGWARPR